MSQNLIFGNEIQKGEIIELVLLSISLLAHGISNNYREPYYN